MKRIILIRHGQTAWNREEIFRGTSDIPLDNQGRSQAKAVGGYLAKMELQKPVFLTSPLSRAYETGALAANRFALTSISKIEGFNDLDFGQWQGRSRAEVAREYPDLYKLWAEEPAKAQFPGGGNLRTLAEKAEEALYNAVRENIQNDLVIVTHRVVTKALLVTILGAGLSAFWKIKQDTACINILEYDGSNYFINRVNDTCHLAEQ